ncbi:glycerophosphodiester phosphodiesterase [Anaerobacillus alkaliphilus]|uniref:Glycerophosphodiester phosphodiesterase n=1 Tax=Anaerobacillus alkaliphilus TaxID=1548597 RepID=A0A4Q0VNH2_9BACI|nr:glycerophosphodiester phosphodiesterase [Anaerobacillus alkaliphilus]RXI96546.1 glycerophosphodiester phosphodiesterase [Anaerobacillus alkaliphilus]
MSFYTFGPITKVKGRRSFSKYLLLSILIFGFLLFLLSNPEQIETKQFFQSYETPLVIAHRGGSVYPENTLSAFRHSFDIGSDILEFDVHMTKDGHLVVIHDFTVDRTTNGQGRVDSLTLAELKQLDAGYYHASEEGYPYRNQGISIPTVREVFEQFPTSYMNIELKAQYPDIERKLLDLIHEFQLENKILLSSFEQKIIDAFNNLANGTVAISGGRSEVAKFVALHKFFLAPFYHPKVDAIQLPTKVKFFNLIDEKLIKGAQKRGMQVHYWTINDREEMRRLLLLGADGIITDEPEILLEILHELGLR